MLRVINGVANHRTLTFGLAGEDFYNFAGSFIPTIIIEARPSALILLGAAFPDAIDDKGRVLKPHHSPCFDFDERAMLTGYNFFMKLIADINENC